MNRWTIDYRRRLVRDVEGGGLLTVERYGYGWIWMDMGGAGQIGWDLEAGGRREEIKERGREPRKD